MAGEEDKTLEDYVGPSGTTKRESDPDIIWMTREEFRRVSPYIYKAFKRIVRVLPYMEPTDEEDVEYV